MKNQTLKKLARGLIIPAGFLLFGAGAFAATTATFSPSTINATPGQTFTVTVRVNPSGVQNYAEKLEVTYPASQLEVRSFSFASNWMSLSQAEYDLTDNVNGRMVKSAGYPGGFSSETVFGTITFAVKGSGNGVIRVGNNSQAFEISSQTGITGNQVSVNSSGASPSPTPNSASGGTSVTPGAGANPLPVSTTSLGQNLDTDTDSDTVSSTTDQTAAAVASGVDLKWVWGVLLLIVLGGVGYYLYRRA